MKQDIVDYFARRANEEEQRAAVSTHPVVKATHEQFARRYRERVESARAMAVVPSSRASA